MVDIVPVVGAADLEAFIDLPFQIYRQDPHWVPNIRRDMRRQLDPRSNPFFEHAEAQCFLARRGGEVVGRIAAIANHLHNETSGDRAAFFGYFESVDDPEVAQDLVEVAQEWARNRGLDTLRGPMSPSVNHECGLLVEGFDTPPAVMMPHNPPYYEGLLLTAGMVAVKNLLAYQGGHPSRYEPVPERLAKATDLMRRRLGLTLRPLNMTRLEDELRMVRSLFNAAWSDNWGFVPFTDHELEHLATDFRPVIMPELIPIVEKDGIPIGFGAALPDLNQPLQANRGGRFLPGMIRIFWSLKLKRVRRARILLLGIQPEFQGRGIDAILYHWIWTKAAERGIYWGEASWILEDNASMNNALEKMTFLPYKKYRIYERPI